MKRGFVDLPDGQVHYRTEGSGDPLLLLHLNQASSVKFREVIPFLSQNYRVIAPDYPGYGDSYMQPRLYNMTDYANCILQTMDALGIKKASIVGDTTGADVAVEIAASQPKRVDKLILNNPPYWKYDGNRLREFDHYPQIPLREDGGHLIGKWEGVAGSLEGVPISDIQRNVIMKLQAQLSPQHGEETHFAVFTYKSQTRLPLIKSPTLVLTTPSGSFHRRAKDVSDTIPNSKLVEIPDLPTNFIQLKPHVFAAVILDFLLDPDV